MFVVHLLLGFCGTAALAVTLTVVSEIVALVMASMALVAMAGGYFVLRYRVAQLERRADGAKQVETLSREAATRMMSQIARIETDVHWVKKYCIRMLRDQEKANGHVADSDRSGV